jgi:hypothetical protein
MPGKVNGMMLLIENLYKTVCLLLETCSPRRIVAEATLHDKQREFKLVKRISGLIFGQ